MKVTARSTLVVRSSTDAATVAASSNLGNVTTRTTAATIPTRKAAPMNLAPKESSLVLTSVAFPNLRFVYFSFDFNAIAFHFAVSVKIREP